MALPGSIKACYRAWCRSADNMTAIQAAWPRIALNTILGREVARWLVAPRSYIPALSLEAPRRIRAFGVTRYIPQLLMSAALLAGRLTTQRRSTK